MDIYWTQLQMLQKRKNQTTLQKINWKVIETVFFSFKFRKLVDSIGQQRHDVSFSSEKQELTSRNQIIYNQWFVAWELYTRVEKAVYLKETALPKDKLS